MKRITRNRYLTPKEAAKYSKLRKLIEKEKDEIVARHLKKDDHEPRNR